MKLYIKSESKDIKELKLVRNGVTHIHKVKKDLIQEIPAFLTSLGLNLYDLSEVTPVDTSSFTGTRQAYTIANALNYYVCNKDLASLLKANYHKEPNINIS